MKKIFRELTKKEFEQFTKSCPSKTYMQSLEMYERYQKIGTESYLLGVLENDKILAAGLVYCIYKSRGGKVFSFPRGPLSDYEKNIKSFYFLLEKSADFLKNKGGMLLQTSPNFFTPEKPKNFDSEMKKLHFKYLGEYEQVKWIYTINFTKIDNLPKIKPAKTSSPILTPKLNPTTEQVLFHTLRQGHRRIIRYATERHNLKLRELKPDEYNILMKLLKETGKLQGFTPREQKFYEQLNHFLKGRTSAIVAELPDHTPVAAAFFIIHGDEVIYLSGGLSRKYSKLGGPHLIQWLMIRYAYANGFKKYNFWGTNPDPSNGVFNFKQGFHGEVEEFVGTFATPLNLFGKLYLAKTKTREHRDL